VTIDGLRLAGLGGIIGNPRKPMRRSTETYLSEIKRLLADSSDILILHEGPDVPQQGFVGSELIRLQLYDRRETLVIAGHSHWTVPLITWDKGLQVLNVDSRGFLLNVVP
jgi:Icc-related predicted phosphoesterase